MAAGAKTFHISMNHIVHNGLEQMDRTHIFLLTGLDVQKKKMPKIIFY